MSHKRKYQISTSQILAGLQRLRFQKGDVIVVKDLEALDYLSKVRVPGLDSVIPLIYAPHGVQKLSRQDLLNLLEQLDQNVAPAATSFESPSAPL